MRLLSIFILTGIAISNACYDEMDCSLAGACLENKCVCKPWAKGPKCESLNFVPVYNVVAAVEPSSNWTRWGGSVVVGDDNKYHMFAAEMADHQGLHVWAFASQVIHAISDTPLGPYKRIAIAVASEAHNPVITRAIDGTWLLFTCGCPLNKTIKMKYSNSNSTSESAIPICPGGRQTRWTTTLYHSQSLDGPWTANVDLLHDIGLTQNVAPLVEDDGTIVLIFKGPDNNTESSLAVAKHWTGPYSLLATDIFQDWLPRNITNEDPWIWRDELGYHALTHRMTPVDRTDFRNGGYAFSLDLKNWTYALEPAYTRKIDSVGGSIEVKRRERPQLLLVNQQPKVLFNGVITSEKGTFTFAQQLVT